MLWIVKDNMSIQIIGCNICEKNGMFQLWVTRPNDKSLMLDENTSKEEILIIKEAIDYAIENKEKALRLA